MSRPVGRIGVRVFLVLFGLAGFAVAAPVFQLLVATPEFLVARQNRAADALALVALLSLILPLLLALPVWLLQSVAPRLAIAWGLLAATALAATFFAQLEVLRALPAVVTALLAIALGGLVAWLLLMTRWRLLGAVLAAMALLFPLRFLFGSPVLNDLTGEAGSALGLPEPPRRNPDIVFLVLDELSLSTLVNQEGDIDAKNFPGFARLAASSDWYVDTLAVSDNTIDSVPSILTGRFPPEQARQPTVAEQPQNLFTLLQPWYRFNVAESVTSLCPEKACPRAGPGFPPRFNALWLDLSAVWLHRVVPPGWAGFLPEVEKNWSGFFAERQVFFPGGWLEHTGQQTLANHVDLFRGFISSIDRVDSAPGLHFLHVLFPHEPLSFLPDGRNYGYEWLRGQVDGVWEAHEWGLLSGKQRNFLQVQLADRLLDELLGRLQDTGLLDEAVIVVVADHGASFEPGTSRRSLTPDNVTSVLRVPMFFKRSGQKTGRRIESPVMIHDLLPTLLAELGVDDPGSEFDGLNLLAEEVAPNRLRAARRSADRSLLQIRRHQADIEPLIRSERAGLRLDEAAATIWDIGPFGDQRGVPITSVCRLEDADLRYHLEPPQPWPGEPPGETLPAYVNGAISGRDAPERMLPFVVASDGLVAASGYTWKLRDRWQFFTLVEPRLVDQPGWSPRVYLVSDGVCLASR